MNRLDLTRSVFSPDSVGVHPHWRGIVVDRVHDMAWLRLHEPCAGFTEVDIRPVPGTAVEVVLAEGRLAGFAFPDASLQLPPSLLVPGAHPVVDVSVHPVYDLLTVNLLDDEPHPRTRRAPFFFFVGGQCCRGQVVVEPSGLLSRVVVHPASIAAPTGVVRQRQGFARLWLGVRRAVWHTRVRVADLLPWRR